MTRTLIVLAVLALLFVAARLAIPRLSSSVARGAVDDGVAGRRLADCPDTPNCRGSDATREGQRVAPLGMRGTREETMTALVGLIGAHPDAAIVERGPDYLHATFSTRLMGYVDDVEFLVDEGSGNVHVRSASRLGRSDFGANAKRVAALREAWERG